MHKILLIRHGKTAGNLGRKYIGTTEELLCEEGIRELLQMKVPEGPCFLFTSPSLRCLQSAGILYPEVPPVVIEELAEMNFGIFENRAYEGDLEFLPAYRAWLDSRCEDPVPGGESKARFTQRCIRGFQKALAYARQREAKTAGFPDALIYAGQQEGQVAGSRSALAYARQREEQTKEFPMLVFVVHGGTIMSILSRYGSPSREYYAWNPANGHGYEGVWDGTCISSLREI